MKIITHRGIDAEKKRTFSESSAEAFSYFLDKGYGLEFDVRITKDNVPVLLHDISLARLIGNKSILPVSEMTKLDFLDTPLPNGHTITLRTLITLIRERGSKNALHSFHLKKHLQSPDELHKILPYLKELSDTQNTIIFDATPETARFLRVTIPNAQIAASVAHPYDIERYNTATGGTLISLSDILSLRSTYDWAWLDEWDLSDKDGGTKKLYTGETCKTLRDANFKIAVVSPELHATSHALLGGESHPDAQNTGTLKERLREIASLDIDAICTDYPKLITSFI